MPLMQSQAALIEVSGEQQYVGGTLKTVLGGGDDANFGTAVAGTSYAVFDMTKDGGDYADLKVSYSADNGSIGSKVLIAQTSDSQGMTDDGTVTILLNIANNNGGGGTFTFDWDTPGSFVDGLYTSGSLLNDKILYTTFDIDYNQFVAMNNSDLEYYALNDPTLLHADLTEVPGTVRLEDVNGNSTVDNPQTAGQFMTVGSSSHQISMGKQSDDGNALFMFEFRDPSALIGFTPVPISVPEPTSVAMSALVLTAAFWIRRRFIS